MHSLRFLAIFVALTSFGYVQAGPVITVTLSGTLESGVDPGLSNLDPLTFPFPELLGGTFSGSFSYDSTDTDIGPGFTESYDFTNVNVSIFDNTAALFSTITDTADDELREIPGGKLIAFLGDSAGPVLTAGDLRLVFLGGFDGTDDTAPSAAVMAAATLIPSESFLEIDNADFDFWDIRVKSFEFSVSTVPEPGTLTLLLGGLGVLGLAVRRKL